MSLDIWSACTYKCRIAIVATFLIAIASDVVEAQPTGKNVLQDNVLMSADTVTYDEDFGVVTASGNVEVSHSGSILLADTVSYNRRSDVVIASGNVALLPPGDDVIFSNYMELAGNLKSGVIRGIQILFSDGSRAAAVGGHMTSDGRTEVRKAVYSPCELCPEKNLRNPLWQIKSLSVIHDKSLRRIFYRDAFLEVFGVPVAYVPFFSHPDPTVGRKTGFLAPSIGTNSVFGITYEQPYYFNISPNKDATLAPIFSAKEGVVLTGEYREIRRKGEYKVTGSLTRADREQEDVRATERTRGHVFGAGEFEVNPLWVSGFDVNRATDATYLGRYGFGRDRYLGRYGFGRGHSHLTSQVYLSGAEGRNFADLRALSFQSLDPGIDEDTVPYVTPLARYFFRSEPNTLGAYWLMDTDIRVLGRVSGTDSRRVHLKGGWRLPFTSANGEIYDLTLSLRSDLYHVENLPDLASVGTQQNGLTGRVVPEIRLDWRYPFARQSGNGEQILEPIGQLIWGPNGGNPSKIPNEDSLAFEFDDVNLFSSNRFPGLDRYEGGGRFNYGIRGEVRNLVGARNEVLFGQSYRTRADDTFEVGTGLDRNFSDFVGRVLVSPSDYLNLTHRFRLDRENFATRRSSLGVVVGPRWVNGSLTYTKLSDGPTIGIPTSLEQVNLGMNLRARENWNFDLTHQRDLTESGGSLGSGLGLTYRDECVRVRASLNRYFTQDADVEATTNFIVRITLRNLG